MCVPLELGNDVTMEELSLAYEPFCSGYLATLKLDRRYIDRTLQLTALSPEIIHAILDNSTENLTLATFQKTIPSFWEEQREALMAE